MIRIGFVGTESFHAEQFAKLSVTDESLGFHVVAIWGEPETQQRTKYLKDTYNIDTIVSDYTDMIGSIDAVMILTRNASDHYLQALPFIEAKLPVWVDKAIADSPQNAELLLNAAETNAVPLDGGSTLKLCSDFLALKEKLQSIQSIQKIDYMSFSYVESLHSPYGGAMFYAIHLCELAHMLCGSDIKDVSTCKNGDSFTVNLRYNDGKILTLVSTPEGYKNLYMVCAGSQSFSGRLSIEDCYQKSMSRFIKVIKREIPPITHSEVILPIRLMHAIMKSLETEETVLYSS